jgi:hypothetical protein
MRSRDDFRIPSGGLKYGDSMKPNVLWMLVTSIILTSTLPLQAQLTPMAPLGPTSAEQCQAFSQQVNEYWARVSADHEACLASYKADRPNEHPGSLTCSRSACQGLHDQLHRDFSLTGKTHQQVQSDQVAACYNTVREVLRRQAQAQQEEAQRKATREREEADRKAIRARDEEQRERQKIQADRASAQKSKAAAAHQATAKPSTHSTVVATQPPPRTQPPIETQKPPQHDPEKQKSQEALLAMRAPFENADKERKAMGMGSPELANPFPGSTVSKSKDSENLKLADPFHHPADRESAEGKNGDSEKAGGYSAKGLEKSFDMMKDDIERGKAQMNGKLSPSAYGRYAEGANVAKSVASGVTHIIQLFEYGEQFKNIYEADLPQARKQEEARLALQVAKDTASYAFTRDAVKEGVKKVVVHIFPDKVAPYVVEYSSAALAAASITFDSSESAAPGLLRYEHWDNMTSKQKEAVLSTWWKTYDMGRKLGAPDFLPDEDFKVLLEQTDKLYKQNQGLTNGPQ